MSNVPSCNDCEFMSRKKDMYQRCRSPQLVKMRLSGILCAFERDATQESGRDSPDTRKCMPEGLNFKRRDSYD